MAISAFTLPAPTCVVNQWQPIWANFTGTAANPTGLSQIINTLITAVNPGGTLSNSIIAINTQTASYTLVLTDAGLCVEMNVAGANNLTIPTNASVAFPIGTVIMLRQEGAGATTIVAAGGVTLHSPRTLVFANQYGTASLHKRGTDDWRADGDLT